MKDYLFSKTYRCGDLFFISDTRYRLRHPFVITDNGRVPRVGL